MRRQAIALAACWLVGAVAARAGGVRFDHDLKADFTSEQDPMEHTRRILGLDGVKPGSSRTRLKSIDGEAFVLEDTRLLS